MKRFIALLILSIIMITGCQSSSEIQDQNLMTQLDATCQKYYESKAFVGMSVAIIKGDRVSYLNYGKTSTGGEPVTEDTIYEIASLSKPMAGILLAYNVNQKKLSFEDPVSDFMPDLVTDVFEGETIQIKHLATHTSGLPRQPRNWRDGPNPYKNYTEEKLNKALEKFKLLKQPGAVFQYSNFAYGTLGIILEKVNEQKYEDQLSALIFEPLGMTNTGIYLSETQQALKALPYTVGDIESYEWDFDALKACAGVKSSTKDLAAYIQANMGAKELESALADAIEGSHESFYKGQTHMGLGWMIREEDQRTIYDHDGLAGGYTSYYGFNKDTQTGVVVLCNSTEGVIPLGNSLLTILMGDENNELQ